MQIEVDVWILFVFNLFYFLGFVIVRYYARLQNDCRWIMGQ